VCVTLAAVLLHNPSTTYACCDNCPTFYQLYLHLPPYYGTSQKMWSDGTEHQRVVPLQVRAEYCCPSEWRRACWDHTGTAYNCGPYDGAIVLDTNVSRNPRNEASQAACQPATPDPVVEPLECFADTDYVLLIKSQLSGPCKDFKQVWVWVPPTDPWIVAHDYLTQGECPSNVAEYEWVNAGGRYISGSSFGTAAPPQPGEPTPVFCMALSDCYPVAVAPLQPTSQATRSTPDPRVPTVTPAGGAPGDAGP
jgi:hypothetical protein